MADQLDIQPLDNSTPDNTKLDIQPLDIQPLSAPPMSAGKKMLLDPALADQQADYLRGAGENWGSMMSGFGAMVPAGLAGLAALGTGQGINAAGDVVRKVQNALTFEPRTDVGKQMAERAAPIMELPKNLAIKGAAALGAGDTGQQVAGVGADLLMDLGIPFLHGVAGKMYGKAKAVPETADTPSEAMAKDLEAKAAQQPLDIQPLNLGDRGPVQPGTQGDLFSTPDQPQQPAVNPAQAGAGPLPPLPELNGEQGNLKLPTPRNQEPVNPAPVYNVTPEGVALTPDTTEAAMQARAAQTPSPEAPGTQGDMFGYPEQPQEPGVSPAQAGAGPLPPEAGTDAGQQLNLRLQDPRNAGGFGDTAPVYHVDKNGVALTPESIADALRAREMQNPPPPHPEMLHVDSEGNVGPADQMAERLQHGTLGPEEPAVVALAKAAAERKMAELAKERRLAQGSDQMGKAKQEPLANENPQLDMFNGGSGTEPLNLPTPVTGSGLRPTDYVSPHGITFKFNAKKQSGGLYMGGMGERIKAAQDESPIRWFTASPEAGRTMGATLEEQSARPNAESQRYGPGQYIAQSRDFSSVYGGPNGRMYEMKEPFSNPFDINKGGNAKTYETLVQAKGGRAGANAALHAAGYDAITFTSPRGDKLANVFDAKPLKDIGPAREAVRQQVLSLQSYEPGTPFNTATRKQGGGLFMGSSPEARSALRDVPGFAEKIGLFNRSRFEGMSTGDMMEQFKDLKDASQNIVQKGFNYLSKGGDYMVAKTQSPFLQAIVDGYKNASNRAATFKDQVVYNTYGKAARKLSDPELVEAWKGLKQQEAAGHRYTPDELTNMGYSRKAVDFMKIHQTVMDTMVPKINAALEAAGMGHMHAEAAYVAAKASGTFRVPMMKTVDGVDRIVGYLGDETTRGLKGQIEEFKKAYPDTKEGPMHTLSPGKGSDLAPGFSDMLNFMADKDPLIQEFLQRQQEVMNKQQFQMGGANTHLMAKKGIPGHPGDRSWIDPVQNAKEGVKAQMAYLNRMGEWAEKAHADARLAPLLADGNGLDLPNLKQYASQYRDMQLNRNPIKIGQAVDGLLHSLNVATGGQAGQWAGRPAQALRTATTLKMLALNPLHLLQIAMDAVRTTPELAAHVFAQGGPASLFGVEHAIKGVYQTLATLTKLPTDALTKQAMAYGNANHTFGSGIASHYNPMANSTLQSLKMAAQLPITAMEQLARRSQYMTFVNLLKKSGMEGQQLFSTAANYVDKGMNNFMSTEKPLAIMGMGKVGQFPYNLMNFGFNEASRLSMVAREVANNPTSYRAYAPLIASLIAQTAVGGIMGSWTYSNLDKITEMLTTAFGKPDSLSNMLMKHGADKIGPVPVKNLAFGGMSTATGIDLTRRLGSGGLPMTEGQSLADTLAPGADQLIQGGKDLWALGTNPANTKINAAKVLTDILPGGSTLRRQFFAQQLPNGQEAQYNPTTGKLGAATQTTGDKVAAQLGGVGMNVAAQNIQNNMANTQKQFYADKQKDIVKQMTNNFVQNDRKSIDPSFFHDYVAAQGDPKNIGQVIKTIGDNANVPATQRYLLQDTVSKGLKQAYDLQRRSNNATVK